MELHILYMIYIIQLINLLLCCWSVKTGCILKYVEGFKAFNVCTSKS